MKLILLMLVLCFSLSSCTSINKQDPEEPIGSATMNENGTIIMNLIAREDGMAGHAQFTYPPDHEEYHKILEHLGGLKPGEEKLVPPWKD